MANMIYIFFLALAGLNGPTKSILHFSKGANGMMGVNGQ